MTEIAEEDRAVSLLAVLVAIFLVLVGFRFNVWVGLLFTVFFLAPSIVFAIAYLLDEREGSCEGAQMVSSLTG